MPGDPPLPTQDWDFPPWQAARLVSSAAQDAARAWAQPVPVADILDVTWDLHRTLGDLGVALWRLSRFQQEAEPDGQPRTRLHEPGIHIYRAGSVTVNAGSGLRDREVLEHIRHQIAWDLPVGGDPVKGPAGITAALELADAAAMAFRIVGTSPSGTAMDRDAAVGAFMRVVDNLDTAVESLAIPVSGRHSARLAAARAGLEQAYTHLREALICSAVDFREPGSGKQVLAMRERYPILPHRSRPVQDASVSDAARLAGAGFPPNSVIEAIIQPAQDAGLPWPAVRASHRPLQRRPGSRRNRGGEYRLGRAEAMQDHGQGETR
jgi:hypothetical protein